MLKRNILWVLLLAMFGGSLIMSSIPIALPSIAEELSMNAVQIGWVSLVFGLASAVLILPMGRLADIFGRKKIFAMGMLINVAGMIGSASSISWLMLISFQIVAGIGSSMFMATAFALLSSAYAPAERGGALGLVVAAVYLGQSIGPTIGGLLTHNFDWRFIVLPTVIFQSLAFVVLYTKVKGEWLGAKGEKFDVTGSALFAVMLFCLLYGFSSINTQTGIWIIVAGICLMALFIYWEMKADSPMLNLRLLIHNRFFSFSGLTILLFYIVSISIPFIMSLYLQYILGFNPQVAGFILLIQPAFMAIFSPIAGILSNRVQTRILVSIGLFIVLLGVIFIFAAISNSWLPGIIIGLILAGFGYAFFASPNTNAIISSVDKKDYGVASAFESTMRTVGITFGMSILILLFSINLGAAKITPEYYEPFLESVKMAFIIFMIFCILSICTSATRGKMPVISEK